MNTEKETERDAPWTVWGWKPKPLEARAQP
jgi:hypothetical protein